MYALCASFLPSFLRGYEQLADQLVKNCPATHRFIATKEFMKRILKLLDKPVCIHDFFPFSLSFSVLCVLFGLELLPIHTINFCVHCASLLSLWNFSLSLSLSLLNS
jgi:hypothetical protein